ncbi:potassium channel family protein [Aeoliella mucimassa]|uniref:Voltage-gated potassium channel Kch n=1 Tax=Aeoliella mucimassa TaxID=2527972 RepID=A0A518AT58_9BACT|nr:potassium channel protein [Aeoliella mucimassa]QDU57910.1 Voltage-gated potassium channel Kch [Aeoliella mucimassa]
MTALIRIRQAVLALAIVFVVAVVGHHWLTGKPWLESIYYFVITVSGVGYTEESGVEPKLQLFSIFVILIGMFVLGYTITLLLQVMIEGQINRMLGIRRMNQEIEKLKGHTIICGLGRMGQTLADEFDRRGVRYVVVEHDNDAAIAARAENMLVVTGDALDEETLMAAGIERAATFVASLHSDADNVFLTLTARNLNPELRIIARGELSTTEKKLRQAGANEVVLPALIGARRMAAMVTRPHTAELMDLMAGNKSMDADLEEVLITDESPILGQTIREIALRSTHQVLVIAIRRIDGEMLFAPDANTQFETGDTMIVMGRHTDIVNFKKANKV